MLESRLQPRARFACVVGLVWLLAVRAASGQSVVVGVIGDFGAAIESAVSASNELAVANLVKRWQPDFVLALGDNNYPSGAAATIDFNIGQFYHEFIHPYLGVYGSGATSNRFFPCLGNHDWVQNGQPSIDYFALPGNERYYRYRASPHLEWFALNSNPDVDGTSATSVQGVWLRTALTNSTARWKIVYFHHPAYSADAGAPGNAYMRWPFATWGATMVMAGHEHYYARLITNGIPYLINGLGGDEIHGMGSPAPGAVARYNGDFGAMRMEATATNLACHFINRNNAVIDTFVLGDPIADPFLLAGPASQVVPGGRTVRFIAQATGTAPLRYQWLSNAVPMAGATNSSYVIAGVQPTHEADYAVDVFCRDATLRTRPARLTLLRFPVLSQHPQSVVTNGGATVIFRVTAEGAGVLRYQWQFNGSPIPDATSSNLVLTNVTLASAGEYTVRVTDDLGTASSNPALLTVLARPVITAHPVGQSAVEGDTVVWSVSAIGTLPMTYSWRRDGRILTNFTLNSTTCFWAVADVQVTNAGNYQVGVINVAGPAAGLTSNALLVVLADRDHDRLPDDWEARFALNPDDPADAAADPDDDGASNRSELLAGTDPRDAASRLRIDAMQNLGDSRWSIDFPAVSNRTYAVEYCDAAAGGPWRILADFPAARVDRRLTVIDSIPGNVTGRYYRVVTPRLP